MALSQTSVIKLYNAVIDDVIGGVRDCFLDDGVDEQVLQELRSLWKGKLSASGAMDPPLPDRVDHPPPPPILQNFQKANGAAAKRAATGSAGVHHGAAEPQQSSSRQPLQESTPHALSGAAAPSSHMNVPVPPVALNNNRVPVQLTLPAQPGVPGSQPRVFTIQIPASALNGQQLHQVLTGPIISATLNLPQPLAATLLQQHINAALAGHDAGVGMGAGKVQRGGLDGAEDSSEEEASAGEGAGEGAGSEDEEAEDDAEEEEVEEEEEREAGGAEEEPLNSEDDVSDEEPGDMFDTENVVVCQYDKITRSRNRWKFYLKDGIMNLAGKDYVFQKANGDAEW